MIVTLAVEGPSDVPVAGRILSSLGLALGPVHQNRGKAILDSRLGGFNRAAAHAPWLVVRDLDSDNACAGALVSRLLPAPARPMCFRIAVREIEAWLLGDREALSDYLASAPTAIPLNPDTLVNPKQMLVNLARRSRKRAIREDFLPVEGTSAIVGPGYLARVTEFASEHWRPQVAAHSSPSLARCLLALERLKGP